MLIPELLGVYLNPDEIEATIKRTGTLRVSDYGVTTTGDELLAFFAAARLLADSGLQSAARQLRFDDGCVSFSPVLV